MSVSVSVCLYLYNEHTISRFEEPVSRLTAGRTIHASSRRHLRPQPWPHSRVLIVKLALRAHRTAHANCVGSSGPTTGVRTIQSPGARPSNHRRPLLGADEDITARTEYKRANRSRFEKRVVPCKHTKTIRPLLTAGRSWAPPPCAPPWPWRDPCRRRAPGRREQGTPAGRGQAAVVSASCVASSCRVVVPVGFRFGGTQKCALIGRG